ncbi:hypothetical protein [Clostridium felsineum]|uniref:hypothetical protein n=1 Tax=Clostridium felsineum TaxID=36839 RepID=UPI00098C3C88|nr:hypothetical protein [Clostridium felsineum]URZ02252.1 hypothetical protein CLAUR_022490 [Clostridium felsineum]
MNDQIIDLAGFVPEFYRMKGADLEILGKHEEAKENYDYALDIDSKHAKAYYYRSKYYRAKNMIKEAEVDMQKCIELDKSYEEKAN